MILKFPATPAFKGWRDFFTKESGVHPAKMNLDLLKWILTKYTNPGDIVLDPMAGTGSTIILASLLGRHGVAVEYEPQFLEMIKDNIRRTKFQTSLSAKGRMIGIQGDARQLSELIKEVDAIISSPPYGNRLADTAVHDGDPDRMGYRQAVNAIITSPPYGSDNANLMGRTDESAKEMQKVAGVPSVPLTKDNIGNLKYEQPDAVIVSPPYGASSTETNDEKGKRGGDSRLRVKKDYAKVSKENIGSLEYDKPIDAVVMSPPYGKTQVFQDLDFMKRTAKDQTEKIKSGETKGHYATEEARIRQFDKMERGRIKNPDNIGSLKYGGSMDAVITSPPYEESMGARNPITDWSDEAKKKWWTNYRKAGGGMDFESYIAYQESQRCSYSDDPQNIGNLKTGTYLEAMLQVYRECHKVLKPKSVMVAVTKNFIRDKKVIRLDLDTIKLIEDVGFKLLDHWYFKLPTKSFWRRLYAKKYPEVPEVEYEDVLVFEKIKVAK